MHSTEMDDRQLVDRLSRLYGQGHKRGSAGGSPRDDLWDDLSSNVGRILRLARAGVRAAESKRRSAVKERAR